MDLQQTAGQYEHNNFFNVWNISNDSENLNLIEEINNTHNSFTWKTEQKNSTSEQSSSLYLDEVFEILDNFITNQSVKENRQTFPVTSQPENNAFFAPNDLENMNINLIEDINVTQNNFTWRTDQKTRTQSVTSTQNQLPLLEEVLEQLDNFIQSENYNSQNVPVKSQLENTLFNGSNIPNDSENLNINLIGDINNTQNNFPWETEQKNSTSAQSSPPPFLDEVFETLDDFITIQSENYDFQNFPVKTQSVNNFLNVSNIPNDSENLNINLTEDINDKNNFTLKIDQDNSIYPEGSPPPFIDELLDNIIVNHRENNNSQNVFVKNESENQLLPLCYGSGFETSLPQYEMVFYPEEYLPFVNSNFSKTLSTITNFEYNDNSSVKNVIDESVKKSYIPFNSSSHFAKIIDADDIGSTADSTEVKTKREAQTVFTDMQLKTLNKGFLQSDYTTPEVSSSLSTVVDESVTNSRLPSNSRGHFAKRIKADYIETTTDSIEVKTKKETRIVFTDMQLKILNEVFLRSHYPTPEILEILERSSNLPRNKIRVWFQNKRALLKKTKKEFYDSNWNQKNTISSSLINSSEYIIERPMNYVYHQNLNQIENFVEQTKNCKYNQNLIKNAVDFMYFQNWNQIENVVEGPKNHAYVPN